jgi:hypothetical protein
MLISDLLNILLDAVGQNDIPGSGACIQDEGHGSSIDRALHHKLVSGGVFQRDGAVSITLDDFEVNRASRLG